MLFVGLLKKRVVYASLTINAYMFIKTAVAIANSFKNLKRPLFAHPS
jgi:hypothetical protein